MKFYIQLSKIKFLKKYSWKFFFVAFIGTHIPLVGLIIYLLSPGIILNNTNVVIAVIIFTLIAAIFTIQFLNRLLQPLISANAALIHYSRTRRLPQLPTKYDDEAGMLMKSIQEVICRMEENQKFREDLLSLISHDLRSPIAQISQIGEVLGLARNMDEVKVHSDWIQQTSKKQLQLLDELLTLIKNENNTLNPDEFEPLSVKDLIQQSLDSFRESLNKKSVKTTIKVSSNPQILAKKEVLLQAFGNLIHNALKFSHCGGVINISSSVVDKKVILTVNDQGLGFDPEKAEELFQRFTNMGKSGTEGEQSTGLGLYLSRKIVKMHNGTLTASSEGVDKGATFTITIPKAA